MNTSITRRCLRAGALVIATLAQAAHAQSTAPAAPRTVAVISLVGDKIDVVTSDRQTGKLNDANEHRVLPFAAAGVDIAALAAAKDVLKRVDPSLDVALLAASRLETFDAQDAIFDGSHVKLPEEIAAAVQREHAAQLVLVTKFRTEARLAAGNGALGNGKIAGLGFYIDFAAEVQNTDTGGVARGFIAPFAYVQLSLIDVATNTVVRRENATSSYLLGTAGTDAARNPWDVLDAQQKVDALKEVLAAAVTETLPRLMGAPSSTAK